MEYAQFIEQLFELCIFPGLIILGKFAVDWLRAKTEEAKQNTSSEQEKKYLDMIYNTISICVIATNQTYVDNLKKIGKFDAEAQKVAFEKTYNAVLAVLSDEVKKYIVETSGDLQIYLTQQIEAMVNNKK